MTFDIDADGILHVSAQDKATGREQSITITASSGLSKDEVERMVKDAERFRQEDQKRREEVEARNNADSLVYQAEKLLNEQGDKMPGDVKSEVEAKIAACRSALEGQDLDRIQQARSRSCRRRCKRSALRCTSSPARRRPAAMDDAPPPGDDEDVVDGEFTEA